MPKLSYTAPPPSLLTELKEVASDASVLAIEISRANRLPLDFPRDQLQELLSELQSLPKGTAEGCRQPLEYTRARLPAIRRRFIQTEEQSREIHADEEGSSALTRGMIIDIRIGALVNSVTTALDEYRALASEEGDDTADTAASAQVDISSPEATEALAASKKAEHNIDLHVKKLQDIAEPSSVADDLKRQMSDASGLLRLARAELRMPDFVPKWYQKTINTIKDYPKILQKTAKGVKIGIDIARPLADAWSHFSHGFKHLVIDSIETAANGLLNVSQKWEAEKGDRMQEPPGNLLTPPTDLNLELAHIDILHGVVPRASWRPWIHELNFKRKRSLKDLTPIAGLTSLETLDIQNTRVTNISPISKLRKLETLIINRTKISDLSYISNLNSLNSIEASDTPLKDVSDIGKLTNLVEIDFEGTRIEDITPLKNLKKLQKLDLDGAPVSNIEPIGNLKDLRLLYLNRTKISDLKYIKNLKNIQSLMLNSTGI
jgi:Leucine-rich repeat (LRR) protein